jgi:hypothetical protein
MHTLSHTCGTTFYLQQYVDVQNKISILQSRLADVMAYC